MCNGLMSAPINQQKIPITNDDGTLDEHYLPERLSEAALEPPVSLVLLFENALQ